ncbi:hypothetical protein [Methylomonas sp. 11b]|uniref:hypothetical protein n=1 Tax=Methylomonas sp. 11b TaxID=1168169 RepID=UPI0004BAF10C|nr:hypothetical protein [Methylomonas sp. 11b]
MKTQIKKASKTLFTLSTISLLLQSCTVLESKLSRLESGTIQLSDTNENSRDYFLPTGRLRVTVELFSSGTMNITTQTSIEADPNLTYLLSYKDNWFFNDNIKVSLSDKGLLNSVSFTVEDKSPEIISNLAETAKNAIKLAAMAGGAGAEELVFKIDETINPIKKDELDNINKSLEDVGLVIKFEKAGWSIGERTDPSKDLTENPLKYDGIFYRQKLPYKLTIISNPDLRNQQKFLNPTKESITSSIVYLPNESPIFALDLSRSAFTKKQYTVAFNEGSLKEDGWEKGSQLLGFSTIPLTLSQKALAVPAELLTIRTQNLNSALNEEKRPLEDQTAILNAQKTLIEAQTSLLSKNAEMLKAKQEICSQTPKPAACE